MVVPSLSAGLVFKIIFAVDKQDGGTLKPKGFRFSTSVPPIPDSLLVFCKVWMAILVSFNGGVIRKGPRMLTYPWQANCVIHTIQWELLF